MKSNPMTANMTDAQLDQQLDALNNIDEETLKLWLGRAQKVAKFFSPAATAFSRANKALGGRLPKILGVAALARRRRARTETAFEMASCAGFVRRLAFVRSVERGVPAQAVVASYVLRWTGLTGGSSKAAEETAAAAMDTLSSTVGEAAEAVAAAVNAGEDDEFEVGA